MQGSLVRMRRGGHSQFRGAGDRWGRLLHMLHRRNRRISGTERHGTQRERREDLEIITAMGTVTIMIIGHGHGYGHAGMVTMQCLRNGHGGYLLEAPEKASAGAADVIECL